MEPRRLLVYALVALPLIGLALLVRAQRDNPEDTAAPASSSTAAYLRAVGAACDRVTRAAAVNGKLSVRALEEGIKPLSPALGYSDTHRRMLEPLRVARNSGFDGDLVDQFNDAAATLGAVDCMVTERATPRLAYPPAPKRGGRTALPWEAFKAEIDGICADNNARSVEAALRIERAADLTRGQKNFAIVHLIEASHRRLLRLFSRLGQPPDDSRPYQRWIETVTARTHAYARQADAKDLAEAGRLTERIAELNGQENWYGKKMGLEVCSSNGPAFPPDRASGASG